MYRVGQMANAPAEETRPLRSDARRNRQRILDAARVLFAEHGLDVSMEEIAGRAGVGVGTAYRRFANRDALIDALFEDRMLELVDAAERALAEPDPWTGLESFLHRSAELQAADRGLKEVLICDLGSMDRVRRIRERILPLAEQIAERAIAAGRVRDDLAPLDMPMLSLMLGQVVDFSRDVDPELWRRYLALLLDGLRAPGEPRPPLPRSPLTAGQLDAALATPPRRGC